MSVPLPEYVKVKDKYCIAYFGHCDDYLVQLKLLRPIMEKSFPGIHVYIACKTSAMEHMEGEDNVVNIANPKDYGYFRELRCDMASHPVEAFMKESGLPCGPVRIKPFATNSKKRGVIVQNGMLPTRSLSMEQIIAARKFLFTKGCYNIEMDGNINEADVVLGVESAKLFQAGANGAQVFLVPTGFGENIFKCMYPKGTIIKL
jgi:hypothetical protein